MLENILIILFRKKESVLIKKLCQVWKIVTSNFFNPHTMSEEF